MDANMDTNRIVGRTKGMLLTPRAEWPVAAAEPDTIAGLFSGYILLLAAIPVLVSFLDSTVIGVSVPLLGTYRVGIAAALTGAVVRYALSLIGVYLVALIVDALAPTFGAEKNPVQALKTVAYSYTAYWVISILGVIPGLALLAGIGGGIYSIYLLNMGLPTGYAEAWLALSGGKGDAGFWLYVAICCVGFMADYGQARSGNALAFTIADRDRLEVILARLLARIDRDVG